MQRGTLQSICLSDATYAGTLHFHVSSVDPFCPFCPFCYMLTPSAFCLLPSKNAA